jgi:large subunit ribosomal protein L30
MAKIEIKLVRSLISRPQKQRRIVEALGLGKLQSTVIQEDTPVIMGMIAKVVHLVTWHEVKE